MHRKLKVDKIDIIIFLIPIIIFGIYLLIYFPGILTADSYNQLGQIEANIFYNNHPFIHTLIEILCLKIWNSPAMIAIFQMLFFCFVWTAICKYNRKTDSKKIIMFQVVLTILVAINPINGMHAITLWKDVLYSYFILLLTFVLQICFDKKFRLNMKNITALACLTMILSNIRHNGIAVVLGMVVTIIITLFVIDRKSKNYLKYMGMCVVFAILFLIPSYLFHVQEDLGGNTNQLEKKLIHIDGTFLVEGKLSQEEINILGKYISIDGLMQNYNPYFMDPIYNFINYEELNHEKDDLYRLTLKKMAQHPKATIRYFFNSTAVLFQFTLPEGAVGTTIETNIQASNKDPDINHIHQDTEIYQKTNQLIDYLDTNDFFHTILFSPAFYLYLGLAIALLISKLKGKLFLIVLLPNIYNLLGLIITIPIQDVRYAYPSILVAYLLIVILAGILVKNRHTRFENRTERPTPPSVPENPKILLIIPAYNEEENILNTYHMIEEYNRKKKKYQLDVIVIDDGSKDKTGEILEENKIPHINLVQNLGIGGAVQTGYQYAEENGYDIAIQCDGDGQHDVNYVDKIIKPIVKGEADLVVGSRFIEELSKFRSSRLRRIGIRIIAFLIEVVTGQRIADPTSGFRAANKNVIRHFSQSYPKEYPEPESLVNLLRQGYVIEEKAVEMKERLGGVSSIRAWKNAYYMINVSLSIVITSMKKGSDC